MIKRICIIFLFLITATVVGYIDNGIRSDMSFHHGKDGGLVVRFQSIVILTIIYYLIIAIEPRRRFIGYLKYGFAGLSVGICVGIFCIIFYGFLISTFFPKFEYYGLTYHIGTIILCYSTYFIIKDWCEIKRKINW